LQPKQGRRMKRVNNLYPRIAETENLCLAFYNLHSARPENNFIN
jgi:hypothetical protein